MTELSVILGLARVQAVALARIGRRYEQHVTGRCDERSVLEVVRRELIRVDRATKRARSTTA